MSAIIRIPPAAATLGWLGVIPFAALSVSAVFHWVMLSQNAVDALIAYGAIILSFMGGVRWRVAMAATANRSSPAAGKLAISVVPALAAFGCWLLPRHASLIGLIIGFAALLAYDLRNDPDGETNRLMPAWYPRLRLRLTSAVLICLGAAAVLS